MKINKPDQIYNTHISNHPITPSTAKNLGLSFYISDYLGNTRIVYKPIYNCEENRREDINEYMADYYPYGKILREYVSNGDREKYLTTQHERDDETGLDYRGARFYDSDIGRFLSLDPLAAKFGSWSPYNYVVVNPILFIDPTGMAPEDWVKNIESGNYEWKEEVTDAATTPEGYSYIGKEGDDIVKDIFGSSSFEASDSYVGATAVMTGKRPGVGTTHATITTTVRSTVTANIKTEYNDDLSVKSKDFTGVNFHTTATADINFKQAPDYTFRSNTLTNDKGLTTTPYNCLGHCLRSFGTVKSAYASYNSSLSATRINNFERNSAPGAAINFNFETRFGDKYGTTFMMPGIFANGGIAQPDVQLSIPFSNTK